MDDVSVELHDGSYHDVDSTEEAFKIAGSLRQWIAVRKAAPVLLEPVMLLEVTVPDRARGRDDGEHLRRRGLIESCEDVTGTCGGLRAVPLAELFGYATDLSSRTFGRGAYIMQFERYQPLRADDTGDDDCDLSRE